jgi:hypothetical protein
MIAISNQPGFSSRGCKYAIYGKNKARGFLKFIGLTLKDSSNLSPATLMDGDKS